MFNKKKAVGRVLLAATIATSVVAVANPAQAASVSTAEKAVAKAEKLASALKNEISYEYRKKKYPKNTYGYANSTIHHDAKRALEEAKKAVASLKNSKTKTVLDTKLSANVEKYINYARTYNEAVRAGLRISSKQKLLQAKYTKGQVDGSTINYYDELTTELKRYSAKFDKVYGETTRTQLTRHFKNPSQSLLKNVQTPIAIKLEINRAKYYLKNNKISSTAQSLGDIQYLVKEAAKKGQKEKYKIMQSALKDLKTTQSTFNKYGALYVATSTKVASPSVFGPTVGSTTTNKPIYLYVGENEYAKLQNTSITGNLIVLGSPAGGGTVYLDNVKVSKTTSNKAGSIYVENIADHSLYLNNTEADSVVINDTDGSNLVAQEGVKVNSLVVSEKAGESGAVTLEAQESGAFETITIAAEGNSKSEGVTLKGNLSDTTITVTGEGAQLSVAAGATIGKIEVKATSNISVAEGSTVKEVTKDSSVTGDVNIDNKGTVEKADNTIEVGGNQPEETTIPTTPPTTGGGGGGSTDTIPVLNSVKADLSGGTTLDWNSSNQTIDLSGVNDSVQFEGIDLDTNLNSVSLVVTSLMARGTDWIGSTPMEYPLQDGLLTTSALFGEYDSGADGIAMSNLRALFLNSFTITGYLKNGSATSVPMTITINLGETASQTTYSNEYVTIEKKGNNTALVTINPDKSNASIANLPSIGNKSFSEFVAYFVTGNNGSTLPSGINNLTLGQLANYQNVTIDGYTFDFVLGN